jgi:glutamate 5-kinase
LLRDVAVAVAMAERRKSVEDERDATRRAIENECAKHRAKAARGAVVVVKVGTSSIMRGESGHLALSTLASLVETLCQMRENGCKVVLVSSGAVGVGCQRMGLRTRPTGVASLQAMAAVGQPHLMRQYDQLFASLGQPIAQVLLSADALDSRDGYQNAAATFDALFQAGVIPVVNENDTVAISELKFGDNDSLSALVAILVAADFLFLATDVDALYTSNPHKARTRHRTAAARVATPRALLTCPHSRATQAPEPGQPPAEPIRVVEDVAAALRDVQAAK